MNWRSGLGSIVAMERVRQCRMGTGVVLLLLLQGCAWFSRTRSSELVGSWTNTTGAVWMIKDDGTFDVDLTRDGKRDAWGKYSVKADTVTLRSRGGMLPKNCSGEGVYHFTRNGAELSFSLISDDCKIRRKTVLLGWHLKEK